jgi:hypothetical protein
MAHFAKLDENNVVIDVNVVNNNELLDENGIESEQKGIDFLTSWSGGYSNWKQTSYNGNMRKNYAGLGYTYQADIDAFVPPKLFASWVLNDKAQWEAPVVMPNDGKMYLWNEQNQQWEEFSSLENTEAL